MSLQHRISQVRKPRIHITCDVEDYSTPFPIRRPAARRPVIMLRVPLIAPPIPPADPEEPASEKAAA